MKSTKKTTAVIDVFQCINADKRYHQCVSDLTFKIKAGFDRASLIMIPATKSTNASFHFYHPENSQ